VAALYEACLHQTSAALPDLSIQYADFAVWQKVWLRDEVLQAETDYWKRQLENVVPLDLATDRPRPARSRQRGAERSARFTKELLSGIKALCRQEGATLYMTLLAAFETLLHRYTGQVDFAVGSPIAGRTRWEIERLIGFFVNTLVMRADLSADPSFRALLRRVKRVALEAYAHQDLPFEHLVSVLDRGRDTSRTPLFRVMFALQNVPPPALQSPDLVLTPLDIPATTAKFDLTLSIAETAEGLSALMEYDIDLFDESTIERMLSHYQTLLEGIVANPEMRVSELPLMTEAELRLVLGNSGETQAELDLDGLTDEEWAVRHSILFGEDAVDE
jgi:non-ribosomal peptide synthetase component F